MNEECPDKECPDKEYLGKEYLGDSVYVDYNKDTKNFVLTVENNKINDKTLFEEIYLCPEALNNFLDYINSLK